MTKYISGTYTNVITLTTEPTTITSSGLIDAAPFNFSVAGPSGAAGTLTNLGTIKNGVSTGDGVFLDTGGVVTNGSTGTALGYIAGIKIRNAAGTVLNYGTITREIYLGAGGGVINAHGGTISGIILFEKDGGTISNFGTIDSPARSGIFLPVDNVGVSNGSSGIVSGGFHGIEIWGTANTVTNLGIVRGIGDDTSHLSSGVYVTGKGKTSIINGPGASISGIQFGIHTLISASAGVVPSTIINSGVISGANAGILTGGDDGVSVTNMAGALISGGKAGVVLNSSAATLDNFGTIVGSATAIGGFAAGAVMTGQLVNETGALIDGAGANGVSGAKTLTNFGTIRNASTTAASVYILLGGGTIANQTSGLISGPRYGIQIRYGAGTVINSGSILGTGSLGRGVHLFGGVGTISNSGVISGGTVGVTLLAGGTVIDSGTITGGSGTAMAFGGTGANRLVLQPGYVLNGIAVGSSDPATNTLELGSVASSGTMSALTPSKFVNFGTINVDVGAQWTLTGNSTIGSGVRLTDHGTLTNAGTLNISGSLIVDPATMANSGYVSGTITLAGGYLNNTATGTIVAAGTAVIGITSPNSVVNAGSISAAGAVGIGIFMHAGGTLVNGAATALVVGYDAGVKIGGGTGAISNSGTIVATNPGPNPAGNGVYLLSGGAVSNSGTIYANHHGVMITGAAGTLDNLGTIAGTGGFGVASYLEVGGYVHNATTGVIIGSTSGVSVRTVLVDGTVVNQGTIQAANVAVVVGTGYVGNAATGLIASSYTGVSLGTGAVANSGTIQSIGTFGDGIDLLFGGGVSNAATGLIVGTRYGVLIIHDAGTITNSGTVAATGSLGVDGIYLITGGSIDNASMGLITGPKTGVLVTGSAGAVVNGGVVSGGTVGINLAAGGTIIDSGTIAGGGTAILLGGGAANLVVLEPGYHFSGEVVGSTTAGATDTLELDGRAGNPLTANYNSLNLINFETVAFGNGGYSTLGITNTAGMPAIVFSGFTLTSETIDLMAIGTDGTISNTDTINHLVTITGSLGAVTLQLDATDSASLATSSDGLTGTNVSPVCFCRGTVILTERGEVPVEDLAVGDWVRTLSGSVKPIVWIGMGRDLVTRANKQARPVIVRQGALADSVPARDLYLTHGHALYIDGVLIPVENLINHRSILWDESVRVVEYYHIELADHDVLLANGAPAESYYDANNRALFQNTRPGSVGGMARPIFAPVLSGGELVERAWAKLYDRAGGWVGAETTTDPDVHLIVDGRRLDPIKREADTTCFSIAIPPAGALLLRSRSGVPSLIGITKHDHRRLGIAIGRIVISQPGIATAIDHDAPALLASGCHPPEDGYSWTDGELTLPAYLFAHLDGTFTLDVHIERPGMCYPITAAALAA